MGEGNESKACFIISIQQSLHLLHIPTILKRRGKRERERERCYFKGNYLQQCTGHSTANNLDIIG